VLALAQTAKAWVLRPQQRPAPATSGLREGAKFTMPDQIGDWKRLGESQRNVIYQRNVIWLELQALHSEVWTYQNGRVTASVALDYPYAGWHDLTVCYRVSGWEVNAKSAKTTDLAGKEAAYFEVEIQKQRLMFGYLLFGGFTETGQWAGDDFNRRMRDRISGTTTYQVQVLHTSYAPLRLAERQQMLRLFAEARQSLVQQVLGQLRRTP
jgi:hypothetical protein